MTNKEIIEILTKSVGYKKDFTLGCIGSSLPDGELAKMSRISYHFYYLQMKKLIESLPWISVKERLPEQDGYYLTLLDCNEHEVVNNWYDGNWWGWCHKHVCYWMPLPEENNEEVKYIPSEMNWKDGGIKL